MKRDVPKPAEFHRFAKDRVSIPPRQARRVAKVGEHRYIPQEGFVFAKLELGGQPAGLSRAIDHQSRLQLQWFSVSQRGGELRAGPI